MFGRKKSDRLIDQAHRELHRFQLGKYRNFDHANKHRKRSQALFAEAAELKEAGL